MATQLKCYNGHNLRIRTRRTRRRVVELTGPHFPAWMLRLPLLGWLLRYLSRVHQGVKVYWTTKPERTARVFGPCCLAAYRRIEQARKVALSSLAAEQARREDEAEVECEEATIVASRKTTTLAFLKQHPNIQSNERISVPNPGGYPFLIQLDSDDRVYTLFGGVWMPLGIRRIP